MMIILSKWNKIYVFSIVQHSKIPEIHSHIIVAGNGDDQRFSLRRCAFAAISTGVSVIPFTNFAIVLPVHGAMTSASKGLLARLVLRLELYIFRYFR